MGNSFGFLKVEAEGGFQFTVVEACKAEAIDLGQTCNLTFGTDQQLISIGNVTRGAMKPMPGIAGIGIWFAMLLFFGVVVCALLFVVVEILTRSTAPNSGIVAYFKESPVNDPDELNPKKRKKGIFRAAGRTFILGVSDTQTIFVGAFLLGFAGQSKCQLTSYHFTVAVNQMMIALSVMTFSVALIRTYWRNPLAAAFRLILSLGAFVGVGLTIFRKANYAPDWPPPNTRNDSAILLPVACLLESDLRSHAQEQARQSRADIGFGELDTWPIERWFFITLAIAFLVAHASIPIRFAERRNHVPEKWKRFRAFVTVTYWAYMLLPPTVTSVVCWARVYQTREWVKRSGWIGSPNTEYIIWDSGQLIAMGVLISVIMNVLSEMLTREDKIAKRKKMDEYRQVGSVYHDSDYELRSRL
ncbi:hypothetical protein P153DRAFT_396491 [Dothidotthia symphoricarpi CBS 119687]|uniref:Uncharacterized protein n=1 Tax=Dothidotthia symphoricarpi CBS 119687 TaxID=1392245 RepID=A0A6A6AF41_9PLEO|nr:uncharacterized protein P153DRAFT_396491 [Dothidotthia symphoricarpi CBS 119687]KAF2130166.1 hypothetical protein P153DRAFT_396491 [Dothidotthia symphoricarpi CBS 119687]